MHFLGALQEPEIKFCGDVLWLFLYSGREESAQLSTHFELVLLSLGSHVLLV